MNSHVAILRQKIWDASNCNAYKILIAKCNIRLPMNDELNFVDLKFLLKELIRLNHATIKNQTKRHLQEDVGIYGVEQICIEEGFMQLPV